METDLLSADSKRLHLVQLVVQVTCVTVSNDYITEYKENNLT